MTSASSEFMYVLSQIPVLVWAGQDNMQLCSPIVQTYLAKLKWPGQQNFNSLQFTPWIKNQANLGLAKSSGGLTFVIVNNAGQFVPYDQPAASLDMLNRWVQQRSDWNDGSLQSAPAAPQKAAALEI